MPLLKPHSQNEHIANRIENGKQLMSNNEILQYHKSKNKELREIRCYCHLESCKDTNTDN